jgi:hypothetical protein
LGSDIARDFKPTHVEHVDALLRAQYVAALTDYLPGKLES